MGLRRDWLKTPITVEDNIIAIEKVTFTIATMIEQRRKTAIEAPFTQCPMTAFLRASRVGETMPAKMRAQERFVE